MTLPDVTYADAGRAVWIDVGIGHSTMTAEQARFLADQLYDHADGVESGQAAREIENERRADIARGK